MDPAVLRRHHVTVSGRGTQPMVLAHGFGCDQHMWRAVAPAFEADYRVVRFDYVGSGRSDRAAYDPVRYATLAGYAQDVLDVVHGLDLCDVVFVGHSVSAMVGVLAAARAPDRFARLVLVCPSPRYLNDPPDYAGGWERADLDGLLDLMERNDLGWAAALAPIVAGNADRPELAGEFEASFCATDPVIARRFAEATFLADNRGDLAGVRVPTLVLQTSEDLIAPPAVGAYVHRAIAGSTLHVLRASGHAPHLSHPDETVAAIRAYLDPSTAVADAGGADPA